MTANSHLPPTPGLLFRLARVEAGLRQQDLADAAGCARSRVAQLESAAEVPEPWCTRLVSAIAVLKGDAPDAIVRRIELLAIRP